MRLNVTNLTCSSDYLSFQLNLHNGNLSNINYHCLAHIDYLNIRGMFLLNRCGGAYCPIKRKMHLFFRHTMSFFIEIRSTSNQFTLVSNKPPISEYIRKNVKTQELFTKDIHSKDHQSFYEESTSALLIKGTTTLSRLPLSGRQGL